MMKQTISSPIRKLKLLLILPLIAGVFYAFATPEYKYIKSDSAEVEKANHYMTSINGKLYTSYNTEDVKVFQEGKTITGKVISENGKPLKGTTIVISGTTIGTVTDANGIFKLSMTEDSPIVISYVGFGSEKVTPDFEKEMVVTLKQKVVSIEFENSTSEARQKEQINVNESNALVIVEGKEINKDELEKISPDKIESISVLKNESATVLYGEKGKDGVILVTLKNDRQTNQSLKLQANSPLIFKNTDGSKSQPLIVKDGLIAENENVNNIPPETIESINVLKGESATKKYGEKGKNGVVEITLKNEKQSKNDSKFIEYSANEIERDENGDYIIKKPTEFRVNNENEKYPLIFVDGVITEGQNIKNIDPKTIESIKIIKDESATKKYATKAKDVVVEITMKKKTSFNVVEEMPTFPGGVEALNAFINANLKYPTIALENGIRGRVFVSFVVGKNGEINKIVKVTRGVDPALDKEALRLVKSMPNWNPGKQNRENVEVAYEIPIDFKIPADYHPISPEKLRVSTVTKTTYTKTRPDSKESKTNPEVDKAAQTLRLIIVPNPTKDKATITLEGSKSTNKLEVSVYDMFGKLIKKESKNGPIFSLSVDKLPTGTYIVAAKDGENQFTGQLVVSH